MRELVDAIEGWHEQGTRFAVASVVQTWRSTPRPAGAAMALSELGEVVGSVSGGCVEASVYDAAKQVLDDGQPQLLTFGLELSGDDLEPGLTCGGALEVFVRLVDTAVVAELLTDVRAARSVALVTVLDGDAVGDHALVTREDVGPVRDLLAEGRTGTTTLEGQRCFVESFVPAPSMLVLGAIDYAVALSRIGRFLGYRVVVCDPRPAFTSAERFPEADEVVVRWPHRLLAEEEIDERTVICVLTHDPKLDVPALAAALASPAAFVGAMGSRRTHEDRLRRLREAGVPEEHLARLSSPIGLDLGARTPEETAVAIAAEIVALRCGGTGARLSEVSSPIHR